MLLLSEIQQLDETVTLSERSNLLANPRYYREARRMSHIYQQWQQSLTEWRHSPCKSRPVSVPLLMGEDLPLTSPSIFSSSS